MIANKIKIIKKESDQKAEDIKNDSKPSDQLNIGMLEIGQDSNILKGIQENNQEKWERYGGYQNLHTKGTSWW